MRDMANKTLAQLYAKHPAAKDAVAKAAGYAVFSDFGFKVWTLGGARGKGVAVNNATNRTPSWRCWNSSPEWVWGV